MSLTNSEGKGRNLCLSFEIIANGEGPGRACERRCSLAWVAHFCGVHVQWNGWMVKWWLNGWLGKLLRKTSVVGLGTIHKVRTQIFRLFGPPPPPCTHFEPEYTSKFTQPRLLRTLLGPLPPSPSVRTYFMDGPWCWRCNNEKSVQEYSKKYCNAE